MRILFASNAPWMKTGYGVQANYLLPLFKRLGHVVADFGWAGLRGGMAATKDFPIYPGYAKPYGDDVAPFHVMHFNADIYVSLQDIWTLPENFQEILGVPWMPWFPVEHEPIPERTLARAKKAKYPVTYSLFGQRECEKAGLKAHYIPHGVDTNVFVPGNKREAKKKLGLDEDTFLVSMVAANLAYPSRKSFPEAIQGFKAFHESHPEAILYLHTNVDPLPIPGKDGINIVKLIEAVGLPKGSYIFMDQYVGNVLGYPDTYMADMYRATDVLLMPSMAEGFGIPAVEAQACGTPVIVNDFSSMPEIVGNGLVIQPLQKWWSPLHSWNVVADIGAIARGLNILYSRSQSEKDSDAARGVAFVKGNYDWATTVEKHWAPLLSQAEEDILREKAEAVK